MAARRSRDFYETAPFMTRALLDHVAEIGGVMLECCSGNGSIAHILEREGRVRVLTNDLDPRI